jgi:hypothetical protein
MLLYFETFIFFFLTKITEIFFILIFNIIDKVFLYIYFFIKLFKILIKFAFKKT